MGLQSPFEAEPICVDCLEPLSPGEAHWYGYRCEVCEGLWSERIAEWRRGAYDPMLERTFAALNPTVH